MLDVFRIPRSVKEVLLTRGPGSGEGGFGEELLFGPAAAEGFDELNGGGEALAGQLGAGALGLQGFAVGVDDFEVANDAGAVAIGGEVGGSARIGHSACLSGALFV